MKVRHVAQRLSELAEFPRVMAELSRIPECCQSRTRSAIHLWRFFFQHKQAFETYIQARLWEHPAEEWQYYYGSPYNSIHKHALAREVLPAGYGVLYQNKVICEILCRGIGVRTPVTRGVVTPSDRYGQKLTEWCLDSPSEALILKPVFGQGGHGVHRVRQSHGRIFVSGGVGTLGIEEFVLPGVTIVQNAIAQHEELASFAPESVNTIRVVTMQPKTGDPFVASAFIRFGVDGAFVDNWSAGGVAVRVDKRTGTLEPPGSDKSSRLHMRHPSSGRPFEGYVVPHWRRIESLALRVQRELPFRRMLGHDIALDVAGEPVLVEINTPPDIDGHITGPLLADRQVLKVLGEYNALINRYQRQLYHKLMAETSP